MRHVCPYALGVQHVTDMCLIAAPQSPHPASAPCLNATGQLDDSFTTTTTMAPLSLTRRILTLEKRVEAERERWAAPQACQRLERDSLPVPQLNHGGFVYHVAPPGLMSRSLPACCGPCTVNAGGWTISCRDLGLRCH